MADVGAVEFQGSQKLWKHAAVVGLVGSLDDLPDGRVVRRTRASDLLKERTKEFLGGQPRALTAESMG